MADTKLVGQNYTTPDLVAKVTGKAKYAEDFRAEGMLFAKLLLSPMPHARVTRIDTSAALAMPGVKAILTADDLPAVVDGANLGEGIIASTLSERGADERAAVRGRADSGRGGGRRADRRRGDREDPDRVRAAAVRRRSAREPAARRPERARRGQRLGAARAAPPAPGDSRRRRAPEVQELKWTDGGLRRRRARASCRWASTPTSGRTATSRPASSRPSSSSTRRSSAPNTSHQPLETRTAMAYWQNGKLYMHCSTQSTMRTVGAVARWVGIEPEDVVIISEYTGGGFGSKGSGVGLHGDSGAAVEEGQRAGDDAHHARGGALHRRARVRRCTRA